MNINKNNKCIVFILTTRLYCIGTYSYTGYVRYTMNKWFMFIKSVFIKYSYKTISMT